MLLEIYADNNTQCLEEVLRVGIGSVAELYLVVGLEEDGWSLLIVFIRFSVVNQNLTWFCQRQKLLPSNFSGFAERISLVAIILWLINIFVIIMLQIYSPNSFRKKK